MFLCSGVQEENQILQQVATWIHEEQVDLARGLTTGRFDREDSIRVRRRHRRITGVVLAWLTHRQSFERSPNFARSRLIAEIRRRSQEVDTVVDANELASAYGEVVQALQEQQEQTAASPAGGGARSCAVEAAATAAADDLRRLDTADPRLRLDTADTNTPQRRRAFCLVGAGQERPGKRARSQPRTKQGTPHPRASTVQSAIDSADELIASEREQDNISDEEIGLVVTGIPLTEKESRVLRESQLLSPPAGSVDFGPRCEGEENSLASCSSSSSDLESE